ncbi:hypothetical protein BYT27DRAFT_7160865 [Phlegmacium glaucopus]|nr:hypothetical protein BYT27DRAFT_7160865 [Phlegmacium glaucopus]
MASRPLIPFLKEPWTSKSKYPAILVLNFFFASGVYVVLFGYCTIILANLKRKLVNKMLLGAVIALFLLASADIAISHFYFFQYALSSDSDSDSDSASNGTTQNQSDRVPHHHHPWSTTLMYKFGLYILAKYVSVVSVISRCYTFWKNKPILIAPIALAICGTVVSFASIPAIQLGDRLLAASFITSAAANLSVTLLIVTRMWWSSRKFRSPMRMDLFAINNLVISLILDSGAIYSVSIFLYLLFHSLVLAACLTQIAGITATTIILRNLHREAFDDSDNTTFSTTAVPTQLDMRTSSTAPVVVTVTDQPSAKK